MTKHKKKKNLWAERLAQVITKFSGSTLAFSLAMGTVLVWLATGPVFNYSNTWQLVINTGTTIVTFLMVFLIQRQQNKDSMALQLKLNELIAAKKGASNRLIDVEDLTEGELELLHKFYQSLASKAAAEEDITACHTVEEADELHRLKYHEGATRSARSEL